MKFGRFFKLEPFLKIKLIKLKDKIIALMQNVEEHMEYNLTCDRIDYHIYYI